MAVLTYRVFLRAKTKQCINSISVKFNTFSNLGPSDGLNWLSGNFKGIVCTNWGKEPITFCCYLWQIWIHTIEYNRIEPWTNQTEPPAKSQKAHVKFIEPSLVYASIFSAWAIPTWLGPSYSVSMVKEQYSQYMMV